MTLTIKLDGNWSSFQLANSAPPLSVTDSAIAPSARMGNSRAATVCLVSYEMQWRLCLGTRVERRDSRVLQHIYYVTPKGGLRLALCHASATLEGS